MLRLTEVALFLVPFALLAAWWWLGWRGRLVLWLAAGLLLALAVAVIGFGRSGALRRDQPYIPARIEGGRIVHDGGP